jgi:release factor glutamine methyltransferase
VKAHGASIGAARRALADQLRSAGIDSPELDARVLIAHALGLDHAGLAAAAAQPLPAGAAADIAASAARRLAGEPTARIVGAKEFWSLSFIVTPAVLVPRPETETVVELALTRVDRARPLRIADLGTGSGAILMALLSELPHAVGIGTDVDAHALAVAQRNAVRLGLADRVTLVLCDYGSALQGRFDLVVSNPPYVARGDIAGLAREVRDHDPPHALDGGADGLAAYRAIAADAPRLLASAGHLVVEIGAGQQQDVEFLLIAGGLAISGRRHDLSGMPRAISASLRQAALPHR